MAVSENSLPLSYIVYIKMVDSRCDGLTKPNANESRWQKMPDLFHFAVLKFFFVCLNYNSFQNDLYLLLSLLKTHVSLQCFLLFCKMVLSVIIHCLLPLLQCFAMSSNSKLLVLWKTPTCLQRSRRIGVFRAVKGFLVVVLFCISQTSVNTGAKSYTLVHFTFSQSLQLGLGRPQLYMVFSSHLYSFFQSGRFWQFDLCSNH